MKLRNYFIALGIIVLTTGFYLKPKTDTYAIVGATIIPMNKEGVMKDQTILIENGKIIRIGHSSKVKIKENMKVIDGKGKFILPGFFDMHAHFFYEQGDNVNTCEAELKLMLANGLTTVRIQCGDSVYLNAREKVTNGKWLGPKLFVSSPQFVGNYPWPGKVFAMVCKTPEEAEAAVKKCKKEGYDEIKITFMVKRDVYDAIIKTAKAEGIKVTGHVGPLVKLPAALEAREQIEHMDEFIDMLLPDTSYNHGESVSDMNIWRKRAWNTVPALDEKKLPDLIKKVKDAGIYVTPTNYFFFSSFADSIPKDDYMKRPDYAYVPKVILEERWAIRARYWKAAAPLSSRNKYIDLRKKMTLGLWKAGVPLMAGSDSPEWFLVQGFSIHDELETFVKSGLSPYGALETATKNPATYLGVIKTKGTVEVGKDADLIILDADPLEDITNTRHISTMILNGIPYDQNELERMLGSARRVLTGN